MLTPQIFPDHEGMSRNAADWLAQRLRERSEALLCLATGGTPARSYALLAERRVTEPKIFDRLQVLKLDEWGGLAMDHPATCETYLRSTLIEPLDLQNRYTSFRSDSADPASECARIQRWLAQHGPIDICVLGLGVNGHLGFNEPATFLQPHAHVAKLSGESQQHSMVAGERTKPTFGLTLGMADILQSREILLLVSGPSKRESLRRLLAGPLSTEFPASLLWLHGNVQVFCDTEAAGENGVSIRPSVTAGMTKL